MNNYKDLIEAVEQAVLDELDDIAALESHQRGDVFYDIARNAVPSDFCSLLAIGLSDPDIVDILITGDHVSSRLSEVLQDHLIEWAQKRATDYYHEYQCDKTSRQA